jgi:uncharacterized membrane protein YagU involved in acid resistance
MTGRRFAKALALCLLIAGTLDIADALIFYSFRGVPPTGILRFIAACLVGVSALHGGLAMAALGLAIHYTITLFWSALFLFAATRFTFLTRHAIASGLLYGVVIYVLMNYVVLPLTRLPPRTHHLAPAVLVNGVLALMLFMGLPIALIAQRFTRE